MVVKSSSAELCIPGVEESPTLDRLMVSKVKEESRAESKVRSC